MSKIWIIRDSLGHIQGPYETQELLLQIKKGLLTGDEEVASYPEGSWKKISTEPQFFDYLLAIIAGEKSPMPNVENNNELTNGDTVQLTESIKEGPSEKEVSPLSKVEEIGEVEPLLPEYKENFLPFEGGESEDSKKAKEPDPLKAVLHREVKGRSHLFEDRQEHTIKHLEFLRKREEGQRKTKRQLYLLGVAAVGLILGLFLVNPEETVSDTAYRFKLPERVKVEKAVVSVEGRKKALRKALSLISKDSIEDLIRAQQFLFAVLKYEPRNKDALLYLCNTNFRLWSFTNKTSKDLFVASQLSKRAYSSGFSGDVLSSCRISEKILYGKIDEAQEMSNAYLNAEGTSGASSFFLRYYKGYLLSLEKDLEHAASFLESSVKLESSWIPSLMLLGDIYKQLNKSQESYNLFKRVLKINKNHIDALFQISILNIEYFSKIKVGLKYFKYAEKLSEERLSDKGIQSRAYSTIAKLFFSRKNNKLAKDYGQKAFDIDSSNIVAKNILISTGAETDAKNADKLFLFEADQLFREGEWKAATAIYEQAYLINKKNGLAAHRISECYWNQNFIEEAIRWAELAILAEPTRVESYIALSKFLTNQFELIQASRVLMKAKGIDKANFKVFRGFAKIELLKNNYEYAIKFAKEALRIYSNDSESILILAKSLEKIGEVEKAFANVGAAMEVSRASFDLENYYSLLLMKTRGMEAAKQYLEQRKAATSGDLKYRVMLANLYQADEQYKKAAQLSSQVNKISDGEMVESIKTYARAMGALGKVERALDFFQKAFLMKPTDPAPLFESGKLLIKSNKPKLAIKQFQRIYRISPNYPGLFHNWAYATKHLAIIKKDIKLAEEVISLSEKELAKNPSYFDSYLLIAEAYYVLGDLSREKIKKLNQKEELYSETYSQMISWYKLCARGYRKAIDLGVQSGDIYIDMAKCYRLSGEVDLAVASAERAEGLDKSNPRIWMETALVYEQKGNHRAALKAYEKFQLIFPNAPNKNEVARKIKSLKELTGD